MRNPVWGMIVLGLHVLWLVIISIMFFPSVFLHAIMPSKALRCWVQDNMVIRVAEMWGPGSMWIFRHLTAVEWDIKLPGGLRAHRNYLLISNHQSWADVLLLFGITSKRVPLTRFFTKRELVWVPMIGWGVWALDMPMVKRYSADYLAKNPERKGEDREITRLACEKYRDIPVTIVNFAEGTRFTAEKHSRKNSPFTHLLPPRAGGSAFVQASMGEHLHEVLDITMVYQGAVGLWELCCGRCHKVIIRGRTRPLPAELVGDYENDPDYRALYQNWLNQIWLEKDALITELKADDASDT